MDQHRQPLLTTLALRRLRCQVRLGCEAWERRISQSVLFDVLIRFPLPPRGCDTDELKDTVCYADLSAALERVCSRQEYRLIEKLGKDAYQEALPLIPPGARFAIRLVKEKPPVPNLEGGAVFTYGDELFPGELG